MTRQTPSVDELRVLADAVCDGALTEHDAVRLEQMLHGNAEAQRFYLACVRLDGYLLWEFGQQTQEATPPRPSFPIFLGNTIHGTVGYFSSGWPVAYLVATVIFGIGLWIGSLVPVSQPAQVAKQSSLPSQSVARAEDRACRQDHRHGRLPVGPDPGFRVQGPALDSRPSTLVSLGDKFALASGLMEITYDTGAKVILQGPVTYEVESSDGGFLSVGKLTAELETRGRGQGKWNLTSEISNPNPQSPIPRHPPSLSPCSPSALPPPPSPTWARSSASR